MTEEDRKTDKPAHCYGMQTDLVKYRAHPGTAHGEKCAKYKMRCGRWRVRQVSENITGPEIKKHCYDETHQPVLAIFQGKALD